MNVNISNEFNFSEVHGGMNCGGLLAKFTLVTFHVTHCGSYHHEAPKNKIHFLI